MTTYTRVGQIPTYQSQWLKPDDLQGRDIVVHVERATVEELRSMDGEKTPKIVLAFHGKAKRMACNKTQVQAMIDIAGTGEFTKWAGVTVTIRPGVSANRKPTIIIQAPPPLAATPEPAPEPAPAPEPEPPTVDLNHLFDRVPGA